MKLDASKLIAKTIVKEIMKMLNNYNFEIITINYRDTGTVARVLHDKNTDKYHDLKELMEEVEKENGNNYNDRTKLC